VAIRDNFDIAAVMASLATVRPVFHSEADFQFAIAQEIHKRHPLLDIRLEIPVFERKALDLLLRDPESNEAYAIELKYKKAFWTGIVVGENYKLANHGADDIGSYDILKDVMRIERIIDDRVASAGSVVTLTNDPVYWNVRSEGSAETNAHLFRIHEGLVIAGTRAWGANTGGSKKGREEDITLRGTYSCRWNDYSDQGGLRGTFRYITFDVS